jgi:hypothetical protein
MTPKRYKGSLSVRESLNSTIAVFHKVFTEAHRLHDMGIQPEKSRPKDDYPKHLYLSTTKTDKECLGCLRVVASRPDKGAANQY